MRMAETGQIVRRSAKALSVLVCVGVLSACANPLVEDASRDLAKGVVNDVVQARFPGLNAAPYTDCVIDNASTKEIVSLAENALTNNTTAAASTVLAISGRTETATCIAQNALGSFLG